MIMAYLPMSVSMALFQLNVGEPVPVEFFIHFFQINVKNFTV